jgi:hypothetical protein
LLRSQEVRDQPYSPQFAHCEQSQMRNSEI